jgi:hypothetical protein
MSTGTEDVRIPAPPAPPPRRWLAVGRYGPSHIDAEDFSRRLGNWGGASQVIGERWEGLVPSLLARHVPWSLPLGGGHTLTATAVLGLDADPVAGRILQRAGVSASDLLLVGTFGGGGAGRPPGRMMIRAADCKVSLDTAEPSQTAPSKLQATFARIAADFPAVVEALQRQVAALAPAAQLTAAAALAAALGGRWGEVTAGEGLFIAPDNGFNRWFLSRLETHRRTGAPLGRLPASGPRRPATPVRGPGAAGDPPSRPHLVATLEAVDAATFLGPLAGWPEAMIVAELDGVDLHRVDLVIAERCWRVGVGLRGAVISLRRRLFAPAIADVGPDGRPRDVSAGLRQLTARRKPADSAGLVAAVAHSVDARRPLWERELNLLRCPLSFTAWMAQVDELRRGGAVEPGESPPSPAIEVASAADGQEAVASPQAADGPQAESGPPGQSGPSGRALYRELTARHRRRILDAAEAMAADGADELTALTSLEGRSQEWREAAVADAAELATLAGLYSGLRERD